MTPGKTPKTVGDLKPAEYNPRKSTDGQRARLGSSMDQFGDLGGIVFNRRTGRLIGGHERRYQLPEDAEIIIDGRRSRKPDEQGTVATGWVVIEGKRWAYREVDVDEAREKAMNVAANKHGGEFDVDLLEEVMGDIEEGGFDFELVGFDGKEMERLFGTGSANVQNLDPGEDRYEEQYGVIVICADEAEQKAVYERLEEEGVGQERRVVVT